MSSQKPKIFYEVAPIGTQVRRGDETLTYFAESPIEIGKLVRVPFGKREVYGIVWRKHAAGYRPRMKIKAVELVSDLPPVPTKWRKTIEQAGAYYAESLSVMLGVASPAKPFLLRGKTENKQAKTTAPAELPALTSAQKKALKELNAHDGASYLLHGVTGSGKTRLYIELARKAAIQGKNSIILVPEIILTPQLIERFQQSLGIPVLVTHSGMEPTRRRSVWQQALKAVEPTVVIGPRSALFSPLDNLGLVVIDEAHETSYKQDQAPRFHATRVSALLARNHKAKLVLGTATPSVHDWFMAQHEQLHYVRLAKAVHGQPQDRTIEIVDMNNREHHVSSQLLSRPLIKTLQQTLDRGKQSILFLNRRGSASVLRCKNCDWMAKSSYTGLPMTVHGDEGVLRCHISGETRRIPARCPECQHTELQFMGGGTKRLEDDLGRLFPSARIRRLDRDSFEAGKAGDLLKELEKGDIDILLGTQMVAKGLDLPNVETVGIVLADQLLFIPDYTSSERTFQLLRQVSGRAGRAHMASSHTVIQTYSPKHTALIAATSGDEDAFYQQELNDRKVFGFPPWRYLLKITTHHKTQAGAKRAAGQLAARLKKQHPSCSFLGPAPAFYERLGNAYRWNIIATSTKRAPLVQIARDLPTANWRFDLDPVNLL